ncbi:MAG TPA: adenylate kinase [Actinomycetota bacterium]|nr:adenylate kinase [Actinomycetota bacterium]
MGESIQDLSADKPGKILVVGITNAGKTTMARRISSILGLPYIELDELFWGPNWTQKTTELFRDLFQDAASDGRWVACGNYYGRLHDLTWKQADMIVFLDLPKHTTLFRLFRRTLGRIIRRHTLWHGNRETFRSTFFDKDSLLLWWLKVQRSEPGKTLARIGTAPQARVVRLRSTREVEAFLKELAGEKVRG